MVKYAISVTSEAKTLAFKLAIASLRLHQKIEDAEEKIIHEPKKF